MSGDQPNREPSQAEASERASSVLARKDRLAALRARHKTLSELLEPDPEPKPEPRAPASAARPAAPKRPPPPFLGQRQPQGSLGLVGALGGPQRQLIARIFRMLTQDPQDGSGLVPGTPFTASGVGALMAMLSQRANDESQPGSKVAQSALRFLEAHEGEGEVVAGASVEKLRMIAQRAEGLKVGNLGGPKAP